MTIIDKAWLDAHPGALTRSRKSNFKGYAAIPGTGPTGETCKTCEHHTHGNCDTAKGGFQKCALMRSFWTRGPGTDIKASSPACKHWQKKEKK